MAEDFEYEHDEETGENFIHLPQEFANNLIYGDRVFIQVKDVQRGDWVKPYPVDALRSYAETWPEGFLEARDVQLNVPGMFDAEIWFFDLDEPAVFGANEFIEFDSQIANEIDTKEGT